MAKFEYKFESIKRIKKILEKKAQKELKEIELEISNVQQAVKETLALKSESKQKVYSEVHLSVQEIKFQQSYERFLDGKVKKLREHIAELNKKRENKLKELTEKSKEHKIFEKLKEKHQEEFIAEENRKEQIAIDEMASIRFNRE